MKWTKEIPTVDGYYWIKDHMLNDAWIAYFDDGKFYEADNYFKPNSEWEYAGPLDQPE